MLFFPLLKCVSNGGSLIYSNIFLISQVSTTSAAFTEIMETTCTENTSHNSTGKLNCEGVCHFLWSKRVCLINVCAGDQVNNI